MSKIFINSTRDLLTVLRSHPQMNVGALRVDKKHQLYYDTKLVIKHVGAKQCDELRYNNWQVGLAVNLMFSKERLASGALLSIDTDCAFALNSICKAIVQKRLPAFETQQYSSKPGCALNQILDTYRRTRKSYEWATFKYEIQDTFLGDLKRVEETDCTDGHEPLAQEELQERLELAGLQGRITPYGEYTDDTQLQNGGAIWRPITPAGDN